MAEGEATVIEPLAVEYDSITGTIGFFNYTIRMNSCLK